MAKGQLKAKERYELMKYLERQSATGNIPSAPTLALMASSALGITLSAGHIRYTMKIMGLRRIRNAYLTKDSGTRNSKFPVRKLFYCECGRAISVGIYRQKRHDKRRR